MCDLADAAMKAVKKKDPEFEKLRIPSTITEHQMRSETDVVIAAMTYVVIPTMEILRRLFPDQFKENSEWKRASEWKRVKEQGNTKTSGSSKGRKTKRPSGDSVRFDLYFSKRGTSRIDAAGTTGTKRYADGTPKPDEAIAIVEFKRRGQVLLDDFNESIFESGTTREDWDAALIKLADKKRKTLLQRNGLMYTKQVSGYALSMGCPYVALFNWENLLLFNFDKMDRVKKRIGESAGFTWINEDKCAEMRKAFLGFLIQAFQAKGMEIPS
jgi:hypothetical protein